MACTGMDPGHNETNKKFTAPRHSPSHLQSDLAEIATRAERFVGVEGGGMDQACECLAREGQALRIDFRPLRWTPVKLPPGALFAVLHSGKEMNKAASAYYNQVIGGKNVNGVRKSDRA